MKVYQLQKEIEKALKSRKSASGEINAVHQVLRNMGHTRKGLHYPKQLLSSGNRKVNITVFLDTPLGIGYAIAVTNGASTEGQAHLLKKVTNSREGKKLVEHFQQAMMKTPLELPPIQGKSNFGDHWIELSVDQVQGRLNSESGDIEGWANPASVRVRDMKVGKSYVGTHGFEPEGVHIWYFEARAPMSKSGKVKGLLRHSSERKATTKYIGKNTGYEGLVWKEVNQNPQTHYLNHGYAKDTYRLELSPAQIEVLYKYHGGQGSLYYSVASRAKSGSVDLTLDELNRLSNDLYFTAQRSPHKRDLISLRSIEKKAEELVKRQRRISMEGFLDARRAALKDMSKQRLLELARDYQRKGSYIAGLDNMTKDEIATAILSTPFGRKNSTLDQEFHFDRSFTVYVPSTSAVSAKISRGDLDKRVREVEAYFANEFGGYTETKAEGGYKADSGAIVEEDIVRVTVFSSAKDWKANEKRVVRKVKEWATRWGQEAIGFEFEGDLYYIDQKSKTPLVQSLDLERTNPPRNTAEMWFKVRTDIFEDGDAVFLGDDVVSEGKWLGRYNAEDELELYNKSQWIAVESIDFELMARENPRVIKKLIWSGVGKEYGWRIYQDPKTGELQLQDKNSRRRSYGDQKGRPLVTKALRDRLNAVFGEDWAARVRAVTRERKNPDYDLGWHHEGYDNYIEFLYEIPNASGVQREKQEFEKQVDRLLQRLPSHTRHVDRLLDKGQDRKDVRLQRPETGNDELYYLTLATIRGEGVGLWEGREPWHKALNQEVKDKMTLSKNWEGKIRESKLSKAYRALDNAASDSRSNSRKNPCACKLYRKNPPVAFNSLPEYAKYLDSVGKGTVFAGVVPLIYDGKQTLYELDSAGNVAYAYSIPESFEIMNSIPVHLFSMDEADYVARNFDGIYELVVRSMLEHLQAEKERRGLRRGKGRKVKKAEEVIAELEEVVEEEEIPPVPEVEEVVQVEEEEDQPISDKVQGYIDFVIDGIQKLKSGVFFDARKIRGKFRNKEAKAFLDEHYGRDTKEELAEAIEIYKQSATGTKEELAKIQSIIKHLEEFEKGKISRIDGRLIRISKHLRKQIIDKGVGDHWGKASVQEVVDFLTPSEEPEPEPKPKKKTVKEEADKLLKRLQKWVSKDQFIVTKQMNNTAIVETLTPLFMRIDHMPTFKKGDGKFWLHYFSPSRDYYFSEKDSLPTGNLYGFGGTIGSNVEDAKSYGTAEWGYSNMEQLTFAKQYELDYYFDPITFEELWKQLTPVKKPPVKKPTPPIIEEEIEEEVEIPAFCDTDALRWIIRKIETMSESNLRNCAGTAGSNSEVVSVGFMVDGHAMTRGSSTAAVLYSTEMELSDMGIAVDNSDYDQEGFFELELFIATVQEAYERSMAPTIIPEVTMPEIEPEPEIIADLPPEIEEILDEPEEEPWSPEIIDSGGSADFSGAGAKLAESDALKSLLGGLLEQLK